MKKPIAKHLEKNLMPSANLVAILALVTEMAKLLKENISKVRLEPLDSNLATVEPQAQVESSKA
jgi:hypothetical protein